MGDGGATGVGLDGVFHGLSRSSCVIIFSFGCLCVICASLTIMKAVRRVLHTRLRYKKDARSLGENTG
jgi:hypothetical protein